LALLFITLGAFVEGAGGFVEVVLGDFVLPSFINNLPKILPPRRLVALLFITLLAFG